MPKLLTWNEVDLPRVIRDNDRFWSGELGRPVFNLSTRLPDVSGETFRRYLPSYPAGTTPAEIIGKEFRKLESCRYLGDGFPNIWLDFGPGALAAMVGGQGRCTPETVWFEPGEFAGKELREMSIRFRPDSDWAKQLKALYEEAAIRTRETPVVFGMTDIGGTLDVLASLRGGEQLLMDLIDQPEEVKRLAAEETGAWQAAYDYFNPIIQSGGVKATSCWASILSSGSCYMLQSDFAYMISPAMFEEFVKPELARNSAKLSHGFYHLDGKGQIGHIPHLAAIPNMAGIQWVPGDGQPEQHLWPEVLEQIEHYKLKLQILGSLDNAEQCLKLLKHPERAHVNIGINADETDRALRLLAEYT